MIRSMDVSLYRFFTRRPPIPSRMFRARSLCFLWAETSAAGQEPAKTIICDSAMARYRFYFLTSSGRIAGTQRGEFDDDHQAAILAEGFLRAAEPVVEAVEAWQHLRQAFKLRRNDKSR